MAFMALAISVCAVADEELLTIDDLSGDIYVGTSLSSYTDNDPIEIYRVKLLNINKTKQRLLAELEALKR
jgi:hypothetical protein